MTRPQSALAIWTILIGAARIRQTLTYSMIAELLGYQGSGVLSQPLDLIMQYCSRNSLPPLTALVVNQTTGQPGSGLSTLEELNSDRERVFNHPWFQMIPMRTEDLEVH